MMISHHELGHFLVYVFAALDSIIGRRPNFVTPNFYEFCTQTFIYISMSISDFLCANDVYLHFIHVWFYMLKLLP